MEKLFVTVAALTFIFIILALYFNKWIKKHFYNYNVEKFSTDETIGLKWMYTGNKEPYGDKINNEKLYDILKYKYVYPIIISEDDLDIINIRNISYDTYIDVEGRFFKPYNENKIYLDIGMRWRKLGSETEDYVISNYNKIENNDIKLKIESKVKANYFVDIDGENIIEFTRREASNMKGDTNLKYDSYITIDEVYYQPYYDLYNIVSLGRENADFDLNADYIKKNGLDSSYTTSSDITSGNSSNTYSATDSYKTDMSNAELSMNTNYMYYRQSGDALEKTILDPIEDTYLPYDDVKYNDNPTSISDNKINEYVIIDIYKDILDRQPNPDELNKNMQEFFDKVGNDEKLKMKIYNSTEYKMIVKLQSNDVEPGLVTHIAHTKLIDKLKPIYEEQLNKVIPVKMIVPLKQCYVYLQYNDYLFKALLMHDNYGKFEKDVINEYVMTNRKLLEIFQNNFILHELRLIANELKRRDIIKRKALQTPIALHTKSTTNSRTAGSEDDMNSEKHISDIMKESENIFNINISLNDKDSSQCKPYSTEDDGKTNDKNVVSELENTEDSSEKTGHQVYNSATGKMNNYNHIERDKRYVEGNRVYNPLLYKQQYRGKQYNYIPNICSYGTKQVVKPVIMGSSNAQGTELSEAEHYTQVGSIMPKFEFKEYEEIN
tara:strand:- start:850 stop:2838 length:1989 start_codon:yes stop_codon:yes gene_type:complete